MTADDFEYDHRFDPPNEDTLRKLELSRQEAAGLERREVKCPICGYRILSAYVREGCVAIKCRRCKFNGPISLRWFRRQTPSFRNRRY